jgi:hypothetical protein
MSAGIVHHWTPTGSSNTSAEPHAVFAQPPSAETNSGRSSMSTEAKRTARLSEDVFSATAGRRLVLHRRGVLVGAAAAVLVLLPVPVAAAEGLTEVRMVGFSGATNLPVWFAIDRGLFEKEGLKVTLERTPDSKEQMANMMEGKYQFATTAFDNIVAHAEGQGSAQYDDFDMVAILGVHSGLNSVVAAPAIKRWRWTRPPPGMPRSSTRSS